MMPVSEATAQANPFLTHARALLLLMNMEGETQLDPTLVRDLLGLTLSEARVAARRRRRALLLLRALHQHPRMGALIGEGLLERGEQGGDLPVHDHRVQALLAAEMLVDHRFGDIRALGDLLDGGAVETALGWV